MVSSDYRRQLRLRPATAICQPQARPGVRAVGQDRVLPQRRPRLSQQRRARHHHHGRSHRSVDAARRGAAAGALQGRGNRRAHPGRPRASTARSRCSVLDFDSELLFVGDAGTTEASRPSRRIGVEWTSSWRPTALAELRPRRSPTPWRASRDDPAAPGRRIPGRLEASSAPAYAWTPGLAGSARAPALPRPAAADRGRQRPLVPHHALHARVGYVFDYGIKLIPRRSSTS